MRNVLVLLSIQNDYIIVQITCPACILINNIALSLFRDFIMESHKLNSIQCIIISRFHLLLTKPQTKLSFHISNKHSHSHLPIFLHLQLFVRRMNFLMSRQLKSRCIRVCTSRKCTRKGLRCTVIPIYM